jgi:hypothetical protein
MGCCWYRKIARHNAARLGVQLLDSNVVDVIIVAIAIFLVSCLLRLLELH